MGYYYNDPSGLLSFWVNDGETVEQARARNAQMTLEAGGDPLNITDPFATLPFDDYAKILYRPISSAVPAPSTAAGDWLNSVPSVMGKVTPDSGYTDSGSRVVLQGVPIGGGSATPRIRKPFLLVGAILAVVLIAKWL